jgi:hypothetical protein
MSGSLTFLSAIPSGRDPDELSLPMSEKNPLPQGTGTQPLPPEEMTLAQLQEEIRRLRATHPQFGFEIEFANGSRQVFSPVTGQPPQIPPADDTPLLTLDQIAAAVARGKKALNYYRSAKYHGPPMPAPDVPGSGGQPNLWYWTTIRPWLEATFHIKLREDLPGLKRL